MSGRKTSVLWLRNMEPCDEHGGKSLDAAASQCPLCRIRDLERVTRDLREENELLRGSLAAARGEDVGPMAGGAA